MYLYAPCKGVDISVPDVVASFGPNESAGNMCCLCVLGVRLLLQLMCILKGDSPPASAYMLAWPIQVTELQIADRSLHASQQPGSQE